MTAPAPSNPSDTITLQTFKGVSNLVAPERLDAGDLEIGKNIDLDDTGHVRRRRGFTRVATGDFHSLFRTKAGVTFVVKDGALHRVMPELTLASLNYTIGPEPLAYVEVNSRVYFSSSTASGVIQTDSLTVLPWGQTTSEGVWHSPVVNPTTTLPDVRGKLLGAPPMATVLGYFNGRIYLGDGPTVWATELWKYNYVDKTRNFMPFGANTTMIAGTDMGFFVGTEQATWFLSGPFKDMQRKLVVASGTVRGSAVMLPANAVIPQQAREGTLAQTKPAVMFLTGDGVIVGMDSGTCYNLTDARMSFPDAERAAAMYRSVDGINQYVAVTETGGTPTSAARIGDYVDAEIRRFQPQGA